MGRKIFISYKYADSDVYNISGKSGDTVRNYIDEIESKIDSSDHIFKGESDGEDLSQLSEESIWGKLKNRIYDSSLTIVMISKNMKTWELEKNQWIPREISYSLKEISRINSSGNSVTSKTNALLAVVVPDIYNSYSYYIDDRTCCKDTCRILMTSSVFSIIKNNLFNCVDANKKDCNDGRTIYYGNHSYISTVKWDDFIIDMNTYINKAYENQDNIDNYNICKEV